MSVENRKRMYDELVAAGRFKDIDTGLLAEFGPLPVVKPVDIEQVTTVKEEAKTKSVPGSAKLNQSAFDKIRKMVKKNGR